MSTEQSRQAAELFYSREHTDVESNMATFTELLDSMPTPGDDRIIVMSDAVDMSEINRHLRAMITFMTGEK